ncbi:hypothetical protein MBOU_22100 [Mycobacterium bourgelatii]|uniref:Cycloserine biosynthesis protein DcsG n=2 Tax=Mycobacterium bourgelatii TaxID=1273442 RepID=A0A7I9YNG9_MYCBU|nr:hypothetical protein MBOU_22100 [Mycobacterium bourgelatii]
MMKLARPDVFHPRVVLAGCPSQRTGDGDDDGLVGALRNRGLHARWLSWDDPQMADAHLVILRATRDFADRLDEFLPWTTSVQNLLNAPAVVAWNADRGYLADLADGGVATVPGEVYPPGRRVTLPAHGRIFVSPPVGTGTRRFRDRPSARAHIAGLHDAGRDVFVQHVDPAGESVLIFLGGKPSHAFTVRGGALHETELDFELWDVGAAALASAATKVGIHTSELLYARAHLSGARLLELQLIDPSLGWLRLSAETRELAQREFAVCVESALERLGLGPFSHRRP